MKIPLHSNFNQLSLKDLLEGREEFHAHLMNKKNVVATAVGRYLIRKDDVDADGRPKVNPDHKAEAKERTLAESVVTDFSWPCILVFVDRWEKSADLAKEADMVPKFIYRENGTIVPVCVVLAPTSVSASQEIMESELNFPINKMGGGFPVMIKSQQETHVATAGCLVTDGHTYYMLTNRHVAGPDGQLVTSKLGNDTVTIGYTDGVSLGKIALTELYPGWKGSNVKVNCDAGLIYLDDITQWKTQVLGTGIMGTLYDLNTQTLGLGLIAEHTWKNGKIEESPCGKVQAFGAVSGPMKGEILALFYRYEAMGGIEYVSDFLISGRNGSMLNTHAGDSGSLWFLEDEDEEGKKSYRPLALHWGQHQFLDGHKKAKYPFALATNLTNICRQLDVQLVRDWNLDDDYTWGKVGHYTVGFQAIQNLPAGNLKQFFSNNIDRITFDRQGINAHIDDKNNPALVTDPTVRFCPLADVPDLIWKQPRSKSWGRQGDENPNHYADADVPTVTRGDLYAFCPSPADLTVPNWTAYYDAADQYFKVNNWPADDAGRRGLISFRVWQIFDYMVSAVANGDATAFMFGAGVITHYVGDGCQPLHGSYMSDGNPADNKTVSYTPTRGGSKHPAGVPYDRIDNPGTGVHAGYEDAMIDAYIDNIMDGLTQRIQDQNTAAQQAGSAEIIPMIRNGQEAAFAVLHLMQLTQQTIHPVDLVNAFKAAKAQQLNSGQISKALYDQFGDQTISVIARGSRYLSAVWEAAWNAGHNNIAVFEGVDKTALQDLYKEPTNLQSYHLDTIQAILQGHP